LSITWMTPLEAATSVEVTLASLTFTPPSVVMVISPPSMVLTLSRYLGRDPGHGRVSYLVTWADHVAYPTHSYQA
jgi:hypothetical protein